MINDKVKEIMDKEKCSEHTAYRRAKLGGRTIRPEVLTLMAQGTSLRTAYRRANDRPRKDKETEDGYVYSKGEFV